jgi:Holliday junction resolvasome RuvABC DNA-binding subunit
MSQREEETRVGEETAPTAEGPVLDPVAQMEGVGEKTAQLLEENGFKTVHDILETNIEKLSSLPGIGIKKAEKLIESAKHYAEGKRA